MREALKDARVRELDALVLAAAGSSDPLANQAVARLARLWGTRHKLPVTAAFASAAPPATGEAVRAFRGRGPPPHRCRLALPGAGPAARPGRRARRRGRCRRGLRARSAPTPRWPVRSSPATPSARSSSCRSEPHRTPLWSAVPRGPALQSSAGSRAGARGASADQLHAQALQAGPRGRSSRPPWTGPGWMTVDRGALRNPKRWLSGCCAAPPPRGVTGADALDEPQGAVDPTAVESRGERLQPRRGRRPRRRQGSPRPGSSSTTPTLTNSSRSGRGTQRSTTYW